jgi:hypothetical protein
MPGCHADFVVGFVKLPQARLVGSQYKPYGPIRRIFGEGSSIGNVQKPAIVIFDGYSTMTGCMSK